MDKRIEPVFSSIDELENLPTTGEHAVSQVDQNEVTKVQLRLEVVYGTPTDQKIVTVNVAEGTNVQATIDQSDIINFFPEIDLAINKVGIWNRVAKLTDIVSDLDRIEIYRPLLADPKEVRKRRAEKAKAEGRADKVTGGRVNPLRNSADK